MSFRPNGDREASVSFPDNATRVLSALAPTLSLLLLAIIAVAAVTSWTDGRGDALSRALFAAGLGIGIANSWPWWTVGWGARAAALVGGFLGVARLLALPWVGAARPRSSITLWWGVVVIAFGALVAFQNRRAVRGLGAVTLQSPVRDSTFAVVQAAARGREPPRAHRVATVRARSGECHSIRRPGTPVRPAGAE